jgi:F0F1-type ATP synthase assembly protein I
LRCHKLCYARRAVEPKPTPNLSLAGAGSVLIGSTAAAIVLGIGIGWLLGSIAWGFLVGAILGLPFGVFMTYKRYGHAL